MKRVLGYLNIAVILLLIVILVNIIASIITAKNNKEVIANAFGYVPIKVMSGSMSPEIKTGDLLISKLVKDAGGINVGDVITYRESDGILITHRVVGTENNGGHKQLITKGDANDVSDTHPVSEAQVVAKTIMCIPYGGYVSTFMTTPFGIALFILLPMLILIVSEIQFVRHKISQTQNNQ